MLRKTIIAIVSVAFTVASVFALAGVSIDWSSNDINLKPGEAKEVTLSLNTSNFEVTGTDVTLYYDHTVLAVEKAVFSNPSLFNHNFFINDFLTDPKKAIIRLTSTMTQINNAFTGQKQYVTLSLRAKQVGTTEIFFGCTLGSTTETNVTQRSSANDILDCGTLKSLVVRISSDVAIGGTVPTPTPTPTATPTCTQPGKPSNFTALTVDSDTVLLKWTKGSSASNYHLFFGTDPRSWQFGAANFGDTDQLLVNFLRPNTQYHFGLMSVNNCGVSDLVVVSKLTLSSTNTSSGTGSSSSGTRTPTPTPTTRPSASPTLRPGILTSSSPKPSSTLRPTTSPTLPATKSATPKPTTTPKPDVVLSDEELESIPSIDNPLDTDQTPVATDETPSTQADESNFRALIIGSLITIAIAGGIIFFIWKRNQRMPVLPPQPPIA